MSESKQSQQFDGDSPATAHLHIEGAPTLDNLAESISVFQGLAESVGYALTASVQLRCDRIGCTNSTPFDTEAGEQAIWDVANLGWTRDPDAPAHYCPTCSKETQND